MLLAFLTFNVPAYGHDLWRRWWAAVAREPPCYGIHLDL